MRRVGIALCCALTPMLALVFVPLMRSPFEAPKRLAFVLMAGMIAGTACACAPRLKLQVEGSGRTGIGIVGIGLLCLGAVELASAAHSPLGYLARPALVDLAAFVALVWGCAALIGGRQQWLMWSIAAAGAAEAMVALVQASGVDLLGMLGISTLTAGRMSVYGTLGNPNFVATFCAAVIPALFALLRMVKAKVARVMLRVMIGVILAGILCTGSRGGIVAAAVGVTGSVLMLGVRSIRVRVATVVLVVLFAGVLVPVAMQNPRSVKDALAGREFIWRTTLAEDRGSMLGSGPNTFEYRYPVLAGKMFGKVSADKKPFAGIERHAQNEFVEVWSELGLFGLLAFFAVGVAWLGVAKRQARSVEEVASVGARAAIAGVVALMTAALFDFPLHRPEGLALLGMWMALPIANSMKTTVQLSRERAPYRAVAATMVIMVAVWLGVRPFAAEWQVSRGRQFEAKGLAAEATDSYRKAISSDEVNGDARFSLVRTLAAEAKFAEALAASQELIRYVNEPECWLLRVRIYERLGDEAGALRELRIAALAFPQSQVLQREIVEVESRHIYR